MKVNSRNQARIYCEFRENSAHILCGEQGMDTPLDRDSRGLLTSGSVETLVQSLRGFLNRHSWSAPEPVLCSIPARGVSLRTLNIPASATDDIESVLALQIEAQFPLSPGELAWGFVRLPAGPETGLQPLLVAAVKKEILQPYITLFHQLQLEPIFTIAGLARLLACPSKGGLCSILDLGTARSELVSRDEHGVAALRVIPWGAESQEAVPAIEPFPGNGSAGKLLLSGVDVPLTRFAARIRSESGQDVEVLSGASGPGRTTANLALQSRESIGVHSDLLTIQAGPAEKPRVSRDEWKWAGAAAILLLLLLGARYLEPIWQKPRLTRQLAELKTYRAGLPQIERELGFLEYIKTNQPPCLDTIYLLADSSPRGLKLQSLTIGRQGDISLRGMVNDPDGANAFRSKLVESGFFSRVVLEEQTPDQNRREVKFRITGQIKPDGQRAPLPEVTSPNTNRPSGGGPRSVPPSPTPLPHPRS